MRQEQRYRNELRVAVQTSIGNTDQLMGLGPLFPDIPVARKITATLETTSAGNGYG